MQKVDLKDGKVLLLAFNISKADDRLLNLTRAIISDDEYLRLNRFRFPNDKKLYAAARLLQYFGLYRTLGIAPEQIEMVMGDKGKPQLVNEKHIGANQLFDFNLSHSGSWAIAVFSSNRIGVDIERCDRENNVIAIAKHYFFKQELEDLLSEGEHARDKFFDLWTLKESYMKARGEGLSLGLSNFGFVRDRSRPNGYKLICSKSLNDNDTNWWFKTASPDRQHRLSLAREKGSSDKQKGSSEEISIVAEECLLADHSSDLTNTFDNLIKIISCKPLPWFEEK